MPSHPEPPDHRSPVAVAVAPWYAGLRPRTGEVGVAVRLALALAGAGIPAGLLWLGLAPRREYEVVDGGFAPLEPQSEALIGADGWLLIITGLIAVVAVGLVWRLVPVRGVGIVVGLATGMVATSVVTWQVGQWLGSGPSEEQLAQMGAIVTPALQLRATPVVVMGAFVATVGYLVLVCFAPRDDLQRRSRVSSDWTELPTAPRGPGPHGAWPTRSTPGGADALAPPAAQPSHLRPATPADPRR